MSVSVAVLDGRKLIENIPQSQRPSPLGEGMWELMLDDTRMLMREQGKELLLGLSTQDIDTAGKLRGQVQSGARLRLRASNIPTDDIDPAAVLDELPADSKLVQDLAAVLRELDAVTLETDLGTTRDLQTQVFAEAPFHKLGLGPVGAARAVSTRHRGAPARRSGLRDHVLVGRPGAAPQDGGLGADGRGARPGQGNGREGCL